jgi:hypothetical protein
MKKPGVSSGLSHFYIFLSGADQKSMPPGAPPAFFFGSSAIIASVVMRSEATDATFWIAASRA